MTQRNNVATQKTLRRKALLAIAFAGGLLNSDPALCKAEYKTESTDSIIQKIANDDEMQPELKAFYLLRLANELLSNAKRNIVEQQYTPVLNEKTRVWTGRNSKQWLSVIASWADQVMLEGSPTNFGFVAEKIPKTNTSTIAENRVLANKAIQMSLAELDKASEKTARLNLYLVASRLYQKAENNDGIVRCNKVLDATLQACEGNSPADEEQLKAAMSVLNSMAYGLIPFYVPDVPKNNHGAALVKPVKEKDFKESETLKLRAVAIADRLDAKNHMRRKAHRDLVLWYTQLGKTELAEKEKLVLFKLVGSNDESILYPQYEGCGKLLWWVAEKRLTSFDCGRG